MADQEKNPNEEEKNIPPAPEGTSFGEESSDEEIAQLAEQVKAKLEEKKSEQPLYTQEQVDNLFKKLEKKMAKSSDDDDDYIDLLDSSSVKREFIRIARLKNEKGEYKFVVGLKNINTDPYIDGEITVQNIENPLKKGELIPWSEFVFEDGTTMLYPYLAFMKNTNGIWAEVIRREEIDISEKFGVVDVKTIDESNEWDTKSTGKKVLAKAVKYKTIFHCKEIKTGKELAVADDVVNKAEVAYADLRKYLEDNK